MENEIKSNAKIKILAIIVILIVALIALGVVYKLKVVGNPVTLTTVALEELGELLEDSKSYGKLAEFIEDEDTVQIDMTGNVTMPMDMGNLTVDLMMQEDIEKREAVMNLDLKLNGNNAIYLEGQLDKDALYFAFKENASKYYYLTALKYPEANELDIDSLLDKFIESFKESVNKDDFKKNEKEITINNEKINAKQYSLKITNSLCKSIMEKFFTKVENDRELMKELTTLTSYTETELKKAFDNTISDMEISDDTEEVYYNIYVYRNTAVRYEFVDNSLKIIVDDYKNKEITIETLKIGDMEDYFYPFVLNLREEKNSWSINYDEKDLKITGNISEEEYDLTFKAEDVTIKVNGTNEYKDINDGLNVILKGNVSVEQQGTTISVPYEFNIKLKEIERVTLKNTANKVDINNMTEVEQNEFNNDLMQIPLMATLMSITSESDYSVEESY